LEQYHFYLEETSFLFWFTTNTTFIMHQSQQAMSTIVKKIMKNIVSRLIDNYKCLYLLFKE